MLKTKDIRDLLISEIKNNNIKDSGYECVNGRKYVEIRNYIFEVDEPYIFDIPITDERMSPEWYDEFYDWRIRYQIPGVINYLCQNPNTRRAVLSLNQEQEIYDPQGYVCTMYMHIFLDKKSDNEYDIEYCVHMRSNEAFDFCSDVRWHNKILDEIVKELEERMMWKINKKNLIWNVDSFHVYEKHFNDIINKYGK